MLQQPHIRQKMHRERMYAQRLGAKSRQTKFRRSLLIGVLGWTMVLAAIAVTVVGSGQFPWASAAPSAARKHRPPDRGSEAKLGKKHGQMRMSGCILIVPQQPLTAQGLATPYQLAGRANGQPCHESNTDISAFVQAAILDPATGQISIYNPLVIDQGTQPAAAPVVPTLPANAVVGIWFGSNGDLLRLQGADAAALRNGNCVDGLGRSAFGQVAYCNAPAFFTAANQQIQMGKLTPPPVGTGNDGQPCPTVRDFSVVDQDQSDNVTTTYLLTQDGKLAQDTTANGANFPGSTVLKNGSDNRLVLVSLDAALGCAPWKAPDLANPGQMVTAQPLGELQAAAHQAQPVALVPSGDPMVLVNGRPNLTKQNLYRAGVDQPAVASAMQAQADNLAYCQNLMQIAPPRIQMDKQWTMLGASLDPAVANNLYTFLAARFSATIGPDNLNCTGLLKQPDPVKLVQRNGVVVDATFNMNAPMTMPPQQGQAQGQAGAQNGVTPAAPAAPTPAMPGTTTPAPGTGTTPPAPQTGTTTPAPGTAGTGTGTTTPAPGTGTGTATPAPTTAGAAPTPAPGTATPAPGTGTTTATPTPGIVTPAPENGPTGTPTPAPGTGTNGTPAPGTPAPGTDATGTTTPVPGTATPTPGDTAGMGA